MQRFAFFYQICVKHIVCSNLALRHERIRRAIMHIQIRLAVGEREE